jgi:soluble lytic murein transglycosylase-like protein
MYEEYYDEYEYQEQRGGCSFLFLLPPLAALLVSLLLLSLWYTGPIYRSPESIENSTLAPLFTPEVHYWAPEINTWAEEWNLDPNMVATVMQIESCGDPYAKSIANARGLFQVMPFHFATLENPADPDTNAKRGMAYLTSSLEAFNYDVRYAFAGYNAGIGGAGRGEASWPAETIRYVYWASGIYADARAGRAESATLQEWLSRGGASLCRQASASLKLAD